MPAPKYSFADEEQLILNATANSIFETSLIDFKMSSIAKNAGISMGSVYKHIQSKEDVLVALAVQITQQSLNVITDVLKLPYPLSSKIVALNLVSHESMYIYPFGYQLFTMLNSLNLLNKASQTWIDKLAKVSAQIHDCFEQVLSHAIEQGELNCDEGERDSLIEEFMLTHWILNVGFPLVARHSCNPNMLKATCNLDHQISLEHPFIKATLRVTNSYPWSNPASRQDLNEIEKILISRGIR
ncbi:TetR/AcrR family transcriptional regulator [Vibrio kasasachensis]|uniref:TetR/AcrR family transcriptional regulator n=1 Tax=Vibrio kasasachensis TaxID=2910248 RepID=UPI003D09EF99